ncbi:MAG: enoyl-CoA hydratase/isomerase family protein [Rubrivivax sp.]|nr:enoyl-CoA hydratase/isomerase family protein [Rubrivivax sp.]
MKDVRYEQRGAVVLITIDRPAAHNAINADVRAGLYEAFARFEADDTALVAILTGAGDKAFCAGMDLKEAAHTGLAVPPPGFLPVIGQSVRLSKPTIAAVNGVAYAGGWMFAQMCDLCVAAEHATFGITEARVGRGMPWAVPLASMVQQRAMMELLLTAEPISARRAHEIGFVNHVVPAAELLPKCLALAETIAANAPLTVRAARELVYLSNEMGTSAALKAATHLFDRVYRSADAQEGPLAFREKRKPRWKGR